MTQDILIENGFIVTMDKKKSILPKGDIYVEGDKIVEIGENIQVRDPEYKLDARHHLVMPGFVNAHSHLQQYFRGV